MREIWHGPILMIVKQDSEGNDYLAVTNCKNDASKLNLPKMVKVDGKELEVKSISRGALYYPYLKSITIPNSVTSIECGGCKNVSSPIIYCEASSRPNGWDCDWSCSPVVWGYTGKSGITQEGLKYAVSKDKNGDKLIYITGTSRRPKKICIPESILVEGIEIPVKFICEYAFEDCSSLSSIVIPSSVTSIAKGTFKGCKSLSSINIPNSVTSIGDGAFEDCKSLSSITIPESVTSIGESAFEDCSSLSSVVIPSTVTSIAKCTFKGCNSLSSINIPNSVTSIGESAFEDCENLTSINIPESVTSIGDFAFESCSLTSFNIPNGVTVIQLGTFWGCKSLTSITIPESVTQIWKHAFWDCKSLTSITIPKSVTIIDSEAFRDCDSATIYCEASSRPSRWDYLWNFSNLPVVWGYTGKSGITQEGLKYAISKDKDGNEYISIIGYEGYNENLSVPETILIENKNIPVKFISESAFKGCESLTNLIIPDSVSAIGDGAFEDCYKLRFITIPGSVSSIGRCVFCNCTSLTSITIPSSVTSIEIGAFENCTSLSCIILPRSVTSIGKRAFEHCTSLTSITIPESVTFIGDYAFSRCDSVTIYCEASSMPNDWDSSWNWSNEYSLPVVWGYTKES